MSTRMKIGLTVTVVLVAVGYMVFTTISSGEALEYFKHVDEVMADSAKWSGRKVKLHGNVVAQTIVQRRESLDFRFALHRGGKWLEVNYTGIVPDAFRDCAELVVTGRLSEGGVFSAEEISAKCPSKYDETRQTGCGEELTEAVLAKRR